MDLSKDFARAVLFSKIDPDITLEAARAAAEKVKQDMAKKISGRYLTVVPQMGSPSRYFVTLMVEDALPEKDAPPEYVDGVYVSVSRLNSLDYWLGPKSKPAPQP